MDGGEDAVEEIAWDCDLGELESDRTGMANNAGADLDEPRLQARQRPGHDLVRQLGGLTEHAEVVGLRMEMQADLVLSHRPA